MGALVLLVVFASGCATAGQQRTVGTAMGLSGVGATTIGIGVTLDGHPRGHPEIVSRQGNPAVGIPITMVGAVLGIVGLIVYVTASRRPVSFGCAANAVC